jgi:hypothetical protein
MPLALIVIATNLSLRGASPPKVAGDVAIQSPNKGHAPDPTDATDAMDATDPTDAMDATDPTDPTDAITLDNLLKTRYHIVQ